MNIINYYQYNENLSSGAQPTKEQFSDLKENNVEVIFNLSPASTRNAISDEAKIVEQLKMEYVHFPVDCSNLRPFHYSTFKGIMSGLNSKMVFVHCGGNIKSSNLLHIYQVLEKSVDETESLQTLLKIQNPEAKWFTYFKSLGMNGVDKI